MSQRLKPRRCALWGLRATKSACADSEQSGRRNGNGGTQFGALRRPSVMVAVLMVLVIAGVWVAAVVHAAAPPSEDQRVYTIASQLQCPVCNGESVADAPTPIAEEMRSVIREKVREGWSDSQILGYFHTRYGDTILESPPFNGFTLIIWIAPLLVLLIGGFVVWAAGREWARGARPALALTGAGAGSVARPETDMPRGSERDVLLRELRRELELDDLAPPQEISARSAEGPADESATLRSKGFQPQSPPARAGDHAFPTQLPADALGKEGRR